MPLKAIEQQTLRRNVMHVLEHGLRTTTYKLATMSAIIDYCVKNRPSTMDAGLTLPIPELARRVMGSYWRQEAPFDGNRLRQSATPQSQILDAIKAVRSASGSRGPDVSLEIAAQLAPEVYRRAIAAVGLCLAQQPLPRLQRSPGSAKSATFLYDDSFLHDKISLSELQRHGNAIRLYPGVAYGLASLALPLTPTLRSMWVDDVLRLNHIDADRRPRLEQHLFGSVSPRDPGSDTRRPLAGAAFESTASTVETDVGLVSLAFGTRLNHLLAKDGQTYSSGEVAAKLRKSGFPMTVTAMSKLRAGVGPAPSKQAIAALANLLDVAPEFLADGSEVPASVEISHSDPPRSSTDTAEVPKPSDTTSRGTLDTPEVNEPSPARSQASPSAPDDGAWGRVIGPDLEDVVAVSKVLPSDCWLAPSQSGMRCRPLNDTRKPLDLPKLPLHRWAWMIANGLTTRQIPTYLIQIRRCCAEPRCCNPDHLIAAAPGGDELTPGEVAALLDKSYVSSAQSPPVVQTTPRPPVIERAGFASAVRPPLTDDLAFISAYCPMDASGCWIAPTTSAVPCRAAGDHRPERDLPKLKVQRWAWMVAHGRASNPLPSNLFQIWKHCGNSRCANPDHLYLTDPDGEESSVEDAEEWLRSVGTERQYTGDPSPVTSAGGRHRASSPETEHQSVFEHASRAAGESRLFADRLNALFDGHQRSDGTPLTSGEVAASLQGDGLALSENLIDRLRAGLAGPASQPTVDALTFYFTVDADYFSAGSHAADLRTQDPTPTDPSTFDTPTTMGLTPSCEAVPAQNVSMSIDEIGSVVAGLAETISDCLARSPADTGRSARLAPLIVELATLLTLPGERVAVGRPLLRRVREERARAGGANTPVFDRVSALLDD